MSLFKHLDVAGKPQIDWEMTPEYTFGTFESWGGKERLRNNNERFYYFFVDGWSKTPKLCLMERAVKYARVPTQIGRAGCHRSSFDAATGRFFRNHLHRPSTQIGRASCRERV